MKNEIDLCYKEGCRLSSILPTALAASFGFLLFPIFHALFFVAFPFRFFCTHLLIRSLDNLFYRCFLFMCPFGCIFIHFIYLSLLSLPSFFFPIHPPFISFIFALPFALFFLSFSLITFLVLRPFSTFSFSQRQNSV